MKFSIPGNMILLGEYSILEKNSLALTASIYPCVDAQINNSSKLTGEQGESYWEFSSADYSEEDTQGDIFASCWHVLQTYCSDRSLLLVQSGVHVSSGSFAGKKGKLGFGSSAASTVACIKGILLNQSWGNSISIYEFRKLAYCAHNLFQGKSGSGYDIYTSTSTGLNLFTNGHTKNISKVVLPFLPNLYIYKSPYSVSTVSAVKKYKEWKTSNPEEAADFVRESNRLIKEFCHATSWKKGQQIFKEATKLGLELGEKIGVTAKVAVPQALMDFTDTFWKASGAGNELPIILSNHDLTSIDGIQKVELYYG